VKSLGEVNSVCPALLINMPVARGLNLAVLTAALGDELIEAPRLLAHQSKLADKTPWTAEELGHKRVDLSGRSRKPEGHRPDRIKKKYF
jgi:hypothetical protein